MKAIAVLFLSAAAAMAGLTPVRMMPPPTVVPQRTAAASPAAPTGPVSPWLALEQLGPAERANARIHIEPGTPGVEDAVRAIEQLWNSGDYDEALAQFRNLGGSFDLRSAFVGINWRTSIPTTDEGNWGPNVRIGNRDSAYCTGYDRNYVNNNLLVAILRHQSPQTYVDVYLSTDVGQSWSETFEGSWTSTPTDLEGVCCGTSFFVAYPFPADNMVYCMKLDAANGQQVQFPSGAWVDTVFQPAPATVTELSICVDAENSQMHAFARTDGDSLLCAWAIWEGEPWYHVNTGIDWCSGMIDCAVNVGESLPSGNWRWVSFMHRGSGDTLLPAVAWSGAGGLWHAVQTNLPTTHSLNTSIAAWKDTVLVVYTHALGDKFYTRGVVSFDGGANWYDGSIPDSLANRELPDVTGDHGEGFAVVHREYGGDRAIMYTHAPYPGTPWSEQDTVSDHSPAWIEQPRIRWLASGMYGAVYISWEDPIYNSVWFNRNDWTGIADRRPVKPALFGLRAIPTEGGTRLAFDNPAAGEVRLRVFDAAGRLAHSENRVFDAGVQTLSFAGKTAGIYFAQLEAAGKSATAKFFIAR